MTVRLLVWLMLIAYSSALAAQAPSSSPDGSEQARFIIREALSEREAVRTGQVRITGYFRYHVFEGEGSFEGPIRGNYVFDRVANVYRFDGERASNARVNQPDDYSIRPPDASTPVFQKKYGILRAADYFANWGQSAPRVVEDIHLRPLTEESANYKGGGAFTLRDVMAFGMLSQHRLEKGAETLEAYGVLLDMEVRQVATDDKSTTIEVGRNDWWCRVTIDSEQTAPLHLEHGTTHEGTLFKSDTEWREVSGVAVPVKYSTWYTVPEAAVLTMELELEWLSVNEDLPDSEFEWTAFTGVPLGLIDVVDVRGDQPEFLGRWIGDGGVLRPLGPKEAPTPKRQPGPPLGPASSESRLWGLYVINGLFVALLVAAWWWRRHAKTGSQA